MKTWEYIQVHVSRNKFSVTSPQGPYLTEQQFKSIDSKGKKVVEDKQWSWQAGTGNPRFLLTLLNALGSDGWELVGDVHGCEPPDLCLILKRRIEKGKG